MRFLWVLCGTLSLDERFPFGSLLHELPYRIVCLGLKVCMQGARGFSEPAYPFPVSLVQSLLWFGLVGFCISLLAGELGMVRSPAIGTDVASARSPP